MFHLKPKPKPPIKVGAETPGKAVDSSAIVIAFGKCLYTSSFIHLRVAIAVVFVAAVSIRNPLVMATRIIEIQHRSNRINTNAIDMELFEPVQCIGYQETAHMLFTCNQNVRVPIFGAKSTTGSGSWNNGVPSKFAKPYHRLGSELEPNPEQRLGQLGDIGLRRI